MSEMEMSSSSSSSEDEEIIEFLGWRRRPYTVRARVNHLEKWDEEDFFLRFRLKKETVIYVLEMIEESIESPTDRNNSIKPIDKLLLTLRFYALGTMLVAVGDFLGVSKSSACKIIQTVSLALARLAPNFIRMPSNEEEISKRRLAFYQRASLPSVIGSIDCTHVKIQSPGGIYAETFRNRKGYFSLNVQTVASADLQIMDIVCRWPGSVHDQTIYNNSKVKRRFHTGEFGRSLLVGDQGYSNSIYLITPLLRTGNRVQELYNEAVTRTRNPVERQYGVWKRRFPVLALGMRLKLKTIQTVILATAVLHNIACREEKEVPPKDPKINWDCEEQEWNVQPIEDDTEANARDLLIANYIPSLL